MAEKVQRKEEKGGRGEGGGGGRGRECGEKQEDWEGKVTEKAAPKEIRELVK